MASYYNGTSIPDDNDNALFEKIELNKKKKAEKRKFSSLKPKTLNVSDKAILEDEDFSCNYQMEIDPPVEKENLNISIQTDSSFYSVNNEEFNEENISAKILDDFSDFSLYDLSSDEETSFEDKNSQGLFLGSRLTLGEFNKLFMSTVDKLAIPETQRDIVLDFIRLTLPSLNNLPLSYHMVEKSIQKPEISSFILCKICNQEISSLKYDESEEKKKIYKKKKKLKYCPNEDCSSNSLGLKSRSFVKVFSLNIFSQLNTIITNHEETMLNYIGYFLHELLQHEFNFYF